MNTMLSNIRNAYSEPADFNPDGGATFLIQAIFIISGFAVVSILAVNWIGTSILNKGADVATCLEAVDVYDSADEPVAGDCDEIDHAADHSFTNDAGYTARY